MARLLVEARRDLARRLGVAEADVRPSTLRRATWPDTSLGCPAPGESYAQVETEGFVIELRAAGARYRYHTDHDRAVYCRERPAP
jgi:hypothetical protein